MHRLITSSCLHNGDYVDKITAILFCQGQGIGQIDISGLSFIADSLEDMF